MRPRLAPVKRFFFHYFLSFPTQKDKQLDVSAIRLRLVSNSDLIAIVTLFFFSLNF